MTPQPKPKTREEWESEVIRLLNSLAARKPITDEVVSLVDAIMSLQDEAERRGKCLGIATESLRLIDSFDSDDFGDPGSEARICLKAIEKARQANVQM